jgi:hypothetical protein
MPQSNNIIVFIDVKTGCDFAMGALGLSHQFGDAHFAVMVVEDAKDILA